MFLSPFWFPRTLTVLSYSFCLSQIEVMCQSTHHYMYYIQSAHHLSIPQLFAAIFRFCQKSHNIYRMQFWCRHRIIRICMRTTNCQIPSTVECMRRMCVRSEVLVFLIINRKWCFSVVFVPRAFVGRTTTVAIYKTTIGLNWFRSRARPIRMIVVIFEDI